MTPERHEKLFSGPSWLLIALLLIAMAGAISYFKQDAGQSGSTTPKPSIIREPRDYIVFYKAGVFGPTNIRIHVGDRVRFQNLDFRPIRIISTGGPKRPELKDFDSRIDVAPNAEYSYVFTKEGIFGYYNLNKPDEGGFVVVRP